MKIVCLDADTLGDDIDLNGYFADLGEFKFYPKTAPNETADRLKDADIVITNKVLITAEIINQTHLKLICVSATGTNNIYHAAAAAAKIAVKNVAGYSTQSVTQQAFASLLTLRNSVRYYDDYTKSPDGWAKSDIFVHLGAPIYELFGKKFCVVGLGEIGRNVANIAKSFGCEVSYYSTSGENQNSEYKRVDFEEALKCDIISIHAPLNEKTKNLFDATTIAKIKNGAVLMNFGRGGIVDESAVAAEIERREIYYIADVLEREPMSADHPFLSVKNKGRLLLTPHIAWGTVEARKRLLTKIRENILNFIKG